jgi:hypothetical protein
MAHPVLHVVYAGRGDAMVLECYDSQNVRQFILVDGGPRSYMAEGAGVAAPYSQYLAYAIGKITGQQPIRTAIISHPHEDHYGGYRQILRAPNGGGRPNDLRLFIPQNEGSSERAWEKIFGSVNPAFQARAPVADSWLFDPVKAIFPPQTSIQYLSYAADARVSGTQASTWNKGLDPNGRSILMYTATALGHNNMGIFFTGDNNAKTIATNIRSEFGPNPPRFSIYKIQHHGSWRDNAMDNPTKITYAPEVYYEAFIYELCRVLLKETVSPNALITHASTLASKTILRRVNSIKEYYDNLVLRRQKLNDFVQANAFAHPTQNLLNIGNTPDHKPAVDPQILYTALHKTVKDKYKYYNRAKWTKYLNAAVLPIFHWEWVNEIKQFYSVFHADAYVVSANKFGNYGHPAEEVLLALALAVIQQTRRARLYLTSGFSVDVDRLYELRDSFHLTPTITDMFCGTNLNLFYLSIGPYMSLSGDPQWWDTPDNARDVHKVTRRFQLTADDKTRRDGLKPILEGRHDQGQSAMLRRVKCRIKMAGTGQHLFFDYTTSIWNIGASGNADLYVELDHAVLPGAFRPISFFESEFSTAANTFLYQDNGNNSGYWRNAQGTGTVYYDAANQVARFDPVNPALPPADVALERVLDPVMMMMMATEPEISEFMEEAASEEAATSVPLQAVDEEQSLTTSHTATPENQVPPSTPVSPLQEALSGMGKPFPGDTANLIDLLFVLFGDDALLRETLQKMPQILLLAGFTSLDAVFANSTAVTVMTPILGTVISSATLACKTGTKSQIQWPVTFTIAGLTFQLSQILVTVENCGGKQAFMTVSSTISLMTKTPLQLTMSWTSSDPVSDFGPIISFQAATSSITDLINALGGASDSLKDILGGQIPLISKSDSEAPTLGSTTDLRAIGFSLCQPVRASSDYEVFSIWIKTSSSGWSSYLPVPDKFDGIVGTAFIQVLHPFSSTQRAFGGAVSIGVPIPSLDGNAKDVKRYLTASLSAIPFPAPAGYNYRFSIYESVQGVSLHDIASIAKEYFGAAEFTSSITGILPGFGKVVDMIRVRELGFGVGKPTGGSWSLNEWIAELAIPSFEILPGVLSLVDTYVRLQKYYEDGISVSGGATFMSSNGKQAIVDFYLPTASSPGFLSFNAPEGLNLADIFETFGLGDPSKVPVLADIATVDILSCRVNFVKLASGGLTISSASAELRKPVLDLGVVTFQNLDLKLLLKRNQSETPETKDGQETKTPAAKEDTTLSKSETPSASSSSITLKFSTSVPSINSFIKVTYDGEAKELTGSLVSMMDYPVSLGQMLQAPIPGSGKASNDSGNNEPGSLLTTYFDQDSSDALSEILDGIKIRSFGLSYGKSNVGTNFTLKGTLSLGPVDLSLTFISGRTKTLPTGDSDSEKDNKPETPVSATQTWSFKAELTIPAPSTTPAPSDEVTLGDLIGGLMDQDLKDSLPSFVSNIKFKRPTTPDQLSLTFKTVQPGTSKVVAGGKAAAASDLKPSSTTSPGYFVFCTNINIAGFSFAYAQCQEKPEASSTKSSGGTKPAAKPTKRVLLASLNDIPTVDLPLIGEVPKPVDQILYFWIQDSSDTSQPKIADGKVHNETLAGLTRGELDAINEARGTKATPLVFKRTQGKLEDSTIVLAAGHHFMMTGKDSLGKPTVILDYVFGHQNISPQPPTPTSPEKPVAAKDTTPSSSPSGEDNSNAKPPALSPYKKSAGPLSISNIGFGWKGTPQAGTLSIMFDASIVIGPIGFALLGFKLEFPITKDTSLQNLPSPSVKLDGLAASFNKPPLTISGAFMHQVVKGGDIYAGALLINYNVYLFQAAGFYGDVTDEVTQKRFKSAFIFCRVNGPIMSVGWAELSGLVAGLGYNSHIQMPTAAQIPTFPLIAPPASTDPMSSLTELMKPEGGVISSQIDSFWVAAGVKVTAFQVLKVDAVLVLSFEPSIKIGIFGLAVADLPPTPGSSAPGKFVHVELGLSATVDVEMGVMKIEGQLTPASYVLDPNCHLTGGFAMYSWFNSPDPELQGDWVFTIGGYHRSFKPPAHYPNPPRLGISWSFSDHISITGEAYFAITPKMCMGGGRLDVTLRAGPLRAWFNAYADFLINYKPFHFTAEGGVSVGVECVIDFCIASITVGATLGATLYLEGPPLSGRISVDFWVTTFDIDFGTSPDKPGPMELSDFFNLVLQGGQTQGMLGGSGNTSGKPAKLHVFSCQSGLVPSGKQETPQDSPWIVRGAGFAFNVSCLFAFANCRVISAVKADDVPTKDNSKKWSWGNDTEPHPFSRPMQSGTPLMSDVQIRIYRQPSTPTTVTAALAVQGQNEVSDGWNKVQRVIRPLSSAIWGECKFHRGRNENQITTNTLADDSTLDPNSKDANKDAMLSTKDGTVNLMTGVDIHGPDAKLSIEAAIEFNVADAMGLEAEPDPVPTFPDAVAGDENLLPVQPSAKWEDDAMSIKTDWQAQQSVAQDVLTMWTKSIASFNVWDSTDLQATAPSKTIKEFEELYLDMPWLMSATPAKAAA